MTLISPQDTPTDEAGSEGLGGSDAGPLLFALVRHGQTEWNRTHRTQGGTDIPLNETGREDASRRGRSLARLPVRWTACISSDLSRARDTAERIVAELTAAGAARRPASANPPQNDDRFADPGGILTTGHGLVTTAALRERGFGEAEGLTVEEIFARWPEIEEHAGSIGWSAEQSLNDLLVPGIVPGLEDADSCGRRGAAVMQELIEEAPAGVAASQKPRGRDGGDGSAECPSAVAVVCHGTIIRLMVAELTGVMLSRLANGAVVWLRWRASSGWEVAAEPVA